MCRSDSGSADMPLSSDTRLDRLYPALSAKERALLELRASKEGRDADPAVRRTMPSNQVQDFNRYVRMLNAAAGDLTHIIMILSARVQELSVRCGWLLTLIWLAMQVEDFELIAEDSRCRSVQRLIELCPTRLIEDPRTLRRCDEDAPTMERVAAELIASLRDGIAFCWQELRAVEIVLEELSAELDGDDLLQPDQVRPLFDSTKAKLIDLHAELHPRFGLDDLADAPHELVEQVRAIVHREIEQ